MIVCFFKQESSGDESEEEEEEEKPKPKKEKRKQNTQDDMETPNKKAKGEQNCKFVMHFQPLFFSAMMN